MPSTTFFFFFNDTATTEIYTLSLHDALPILAMGKSISGCANPQQGSDKLPACRLRFSGQARSLSLRSSSANAFPILLLTAILIAEGCQRAWTSGNSCVIDVDGGTYAVTRPYSH